MYVKIERGGTGLRGVHQSVFYCRPCPFKGCSVRSLKQTEMKVNFWHRHVKDTVVILEKGNLPDTCFPLCDMLVPLKSLNGMHRCTSQCNHGVERKRRGLAEEEEREVTARAFSPYERPLYMVTSFRYLGRVILAADDDCQAVVRNLFWARAVWRRMTCILSRDGASPRVSDFFIKSMVQAVLLFGLETWVVLPRMVKVLGGF